MIQLSVLQTTVHSITIGEQGKTLVYKLSGAADFGGSKTCTVFGIQPVDITFYPNSSAHAKLVSMSVGTSVKEVWCVLPNGSKQVNVDPAYLSLSATKIRNLSTQDVLDVSQNFHAFDPYFDLDFVYDRIAHAVIGFHTGRSTSIPYPVWSLSTAGYYGYHVVRDAQDRRTIYFGVEERVIVYGHEFQVVDQYSWQGAKAFGTYIYVLDNGIKCYQYDGTYVSTIAGDFQSLCTRDGVAYALVESELNALPISGTQLGAPVQLLPVLDTNVDCTYDGQQITHDSDVYQAPNALAFYVLGTTPFCVEATRNYSQLMVAQQPLLELVSKVTTDTHVIVQLQCNGVGSQAITNIVESNAKFYVDGIEVQQVFGNQLLEVRAPLTDSTIAFAVASSPFQTKTSTDFIPDAFGWAPMGDAEIGTEYQTPAIQLQGFDGAVQLNSNAQIIVDGEPVPSGTEFSPSSVVALRFVQTGNIDTWWLAAGATVGQCVSITAALIPTVAPRSRAYAPLGTHVSRAFTNVSDKPLLISVQEPAFLKDSAARSMLLPPALSAYVCVPCHQYVHYLVPVVFGATTHQYEVWADAEFLDPQPHTDAAVRYVEAQMPVLDFSSIPPNFWTQILLPAGTNCLVDGVPQPFPLDARGYANGMRSIEVDCSQSVVLNALPNASGWPMLLGDALATWDYDIIEGQTALQLEQAFATLAPDSEHHVTQGQWSSPMACTAVSRSTNSVAVPEQDPVLRNYSESAPPNFEHSVFDVEAIDVPDSVALIAVPHELVVPDTVALIAVPHELAVPDTLFFANTPHDTDPMAPNLVAHESQQGTGLDPVACAPHTLYGTESGVAPVSEPTAYAIVCDTVAADRHLDGEYALSPIARDCSAAAQVTLKSIIKRDPIPNPVTLDPQLPPPWYKRSVQCDPIFKQVTHDYETALPWEVALSLHAHDTEVRLNASDVHTRNQIHQAELLPFQRQDPVPAQSKLLADQAVSQNIAEHSLVAALTQDTVPHSVWLEALYTGFSLHSVGQVWETVDHPYSTVAALPPTLVYAQLDNGAPNLLDRGYFPTELAALQNAINVWGAEPQEVAGRQLPTGEWYWIRITVCQNMCTSCPPTGYIQGG